MECKYAVKTDIDQSQINNLQFPLYLESQNNHYEVDSLVLPRLSQFHIHIGSRILLNKNELKNNHLKKGPISLNRKKISN